MNSLVSVIMPCYNSERYIKFSIESVLNQTYTNWELIIVDDCSTDSSMSIIKYFAELDNRIKFYTTSKVSGSPTIPRNIGISNASGRYIAFLDSDDLWVEEKLSIQLHLFEFTNVAIVFSDYEKMDDKGALRNRLVKAPIIVDYKLLLTGNVIACCTCVYDVHKIGKQFFNLQGHEDYALWLKILKMGFLARNCGVVLSKYRVRTNSISSNKIKAIIWVYNIYRNNESFSMYYSLYLTTVTLYKSFLKYFK